MGEIIVAHDIRDGLKANQQITADGLRRMDTNNLDSGTVDGLGGDSSTGDNAIADEGIDLSGICMSQDWTVPSPMPSGIRQDLKLYFKANIAASATIDISCMTPMKVMP